MAYFAPDMKVHYDVCPVCHAADIGPLFTVTDHSISGEDFIIWQCRRCSLRFTQDVPDEMSIGRYYQSPEYVSHSNTSKGLVNQLYQKVRRLTLSQKASFVIRHTKKKGKLLDLGAGVGAFLHAMQEKGWEVVGIEPDENARAQAKKDFGINLLQANAWDAWPPESFDAISLWHVLEHVHALHPYMEKLKSLLKKDGKLFIAVPNYRSLDASIYASNWAAYDVPRHLYHFSPASMEMLVRAHGMKLTEKKPMWFDSFYISLLSSKYRNGSIRWIGAGLSGLRSNMKALLNKDRCSSLVYVIEK